APRPARATPLATPRTAPPLPHAPRTSAPPPAHRPNAPAPAPASPRPIRHPPPAAAPAKPRRTAPPPTLRTPRRTPPRALQPPPSASRSDSRVTAVSTSPDGTNAVQCAAAGPSTATGSYDAVSPTTSGRRARTPSALRVTASLPPPSPSSPPSPSNRTVRR